MNKHVGIICDLKNNETLFAVNGMKEALELRGITYEICGQYENNDDYDFIIAVGGDGTILSAAAYACTLKLPVLGVNKGRVGFLSEIEVEAFPQAIDRIYAGNYGIRHRMMLKCTTPQGEFCTLNDVIVYKRVFSGVAQLEISISNEAVGNCFCDGLVICTPTGSTAYSISAGGPVIMPELDSITVTPVCPHSLSFRPIVAPQNAVVEINLNSDCSVAFDGTKTVELPKGARIRVEKAEVSAQFITLRSQNLFELIRKKLT